jgi:hypothetical protein
VQGEAAATRAKTGGSVEGAVGLEERRVAVGEFAEAVSADEEPETLVGRASGQGQVEIGQGIGIRVIAAENGGFLLTKNIDGLVGLAMGQEILDGRTEVFGAVAEENP